MRIMSHPEEPCLATSSGGLISILAPKLDQIRFLDIATGLSNTCRYGGQLRDRLFLSVAEHSLLMTHKAVDTGVARSMEDALKVLLHDASEAYIGDLPTPLKRLLPDFSVIEKRLQSVIEDSFGLNANNVQITRADVKKLDNRIRLDEIEMAINDPAKTYGLERVWGLDPDLQPLGADVRCLDRADAFEQFVDTFIWVCEMPARDPGTSAAVEPYLHQARLLRSDAPHFEIA